MARGGRLAFLALCLGVLESGKCFQHGVHVPLRSAIRARSSRSWNGSPAAPWTAATRSSSLLHERTVPFSGAWKRVRTRFSGKHFVLMSAADDAGNLDLIELERQFEARIAEAVPSLVEALNAGPGAVAIVDNLLGAEACQAMRSEAIAVTEQDLLCGSASAYSTAPPDTFEARYGDEPGISATVLTRGTRAGKLTPQCGAYIAAASRALARGLSSARRGKLVHVEEEGREADHQLRLTTVAQQAHMDNSFDGVNCRLVTTLYYLNPSWDPSHGGRFLPWPCSDDFAAESARSAELPATVLTYQVRFSPITLPARTVPPPARRQVQPARRSRSLRLILGNRHRVRIKEVMSSRAAAGPSRRGAAPDPRACARPCAPQHLAQARALARLRGARGKGAPPAGARPTPPRHWKPCTCGIPQGYGGGGASLSRWFHRGGAGTS
jgi:hypothetical protein